MATSSRIGCMAAFITLLIAGLPQAKTLTINGPIDSVQFGRSVTSLPNGNIVVTDPSAGPSGVGAVYLYRPDGSLVSTLKGGTPNDQIGNRGITVLPSGNFLVVSDNWNTGAFSRAGAVTFVNGSTGLNGTVSALNSLVGNGNNDSDNRQVHVLGSGNYLVFWPLADLPGGTNQGAVTWGSGTAGVSGAISASNSLVGTPGGSVSAASLAELTNGNYVLAISNWSGLGAAVWCPRNTGCTGTVETNVALKGTTPGDNVGLDIVPLSNGHYVVGSAFWNDGATADVGAITWANGNTGLNGSPSPANSWIGSTAGDQAGSQLLPLTNGHVVILSPFWQVTPGVRVGAATWMSGTGPTSGVIGSTNSMIGSTHGDSIGSSSVALSNGNYVIGSSSWQNGAADNAGAARWGNGLGGSVGPVSAANALVGSTSGDTIGNQIEALSTGNYVVRSTNWDNGAATNAGAVAFGNGLTGSSGTISASNALVGTSSNDEYGMIFRQLSNGNFVVASTAWNNNATADVGIVTWVNGNSGGNGAVSGGNSYIGSSANDRIGQDLIALNNGNYLVSSPRFDNGLADVGAVTWGNGNTGSSGFVNAANSIVGTQASDGLFQLSGLALANGDGLVAWPGFDNGGINDAGAILRVAGNGPSSGTITAASAFVGTSTSEAVGFSQSKLYADDLLVVRSLMWDTGMAPLNVGAACLRDARNGLVGATGPDACVVGSVANGGSASIVADYSPASRQMAVGLQAENKVVLFDFDLFADGFE